MCIMEQNRINLGVFALCLMEGMFCLAAQKYMCVLLSRYFALVLVSQDH